MSSRWPPQRTRCRGCSGSTSRGGCAAGGRSRCARSSSGRAAPPPELVRPRCVEANNPDRARREPVPSTVPPCGLFITWPGARTVRSAARGAGSRSSTPTLNPANSSRTRPSPTMSRPCASSTRRHWPRAYPVHSTTTADAEGGAPPFIGPRAAIAVEAPACRGRLVVRSARRVPAERGPHDRRQLPVPPEELPFRL